MKEITTLLSFNAYSVPMLVLLFRPFIVKAAVNARRLRPSFRQLLSGPCYSAVQALCPSHPSYHMIHVVQVE